MSEFSQSRLEAKILEGISSLIVSGAIKNHNLSTLTSVTRGELSPDNAAAKVYVSSFYEDGRLDRSVKALNQASAFIQARLASILRTKNTPVLTFYRDDSYAEGERVNNLISEAMKEINE